MPQVGFTDHFFKGLEALSREEQNRVREAVFAFMQDPKHPSFKLHRLEDIKTDRFWSARVSKDLRLILYHHPEMGWIFAYVGHHDDAYRWAETHQAEVHPKLGLLQIFRVVEEVRVEPRKIKPLLPDYPDDYLLDLGVPPSYLKPLRLVETEDQLLGLIEGLPQDVQERLLDLAAGRPVTLPPKLAPSEEWFKHPLSRQHIHFIQNLDELRQALSYPWERWMVFLHPAQREAVERVFQGPARVTGPAGTGKTVVALHRAAALARRYPEEPLLLTTFNRFLASRLRSGLQRLLGEVPPNLTVENLHSLARRLHEQHVGPVKLVKEEDYGPWLLEAAQGLEYGKNFLLSEFAFADAWGLYTWEAYRGFPRTGRGVPLTARERLKLFGAFQKVWGRMENEGALTFNGLLHRLRQRAEEGALPRFRAVVVDEAQDLGPAELLLVRALAQEAPDSLFFALDPAQRIYKSPLSWQALGLEVRGRSIRLKVNYRTTREIAKRAEAVLPKEVEGEMREVLSLLQGPEPEIRGFPTQEACQAELVRWLRWLLEQGVRPEEVAVLARVRKLAEGLAEGLRRAGIPVVLLSDQEDPGEGVRLGTVHSAKGLEFRAVALFGANRGLFPLESLLREAPSEADREALLAQERNLLYVAMSRARERLWVGYWDEGSPFLTP
ncbi:3'-5' exonuclease [Thermus filiformis]|uniref:DNA 3'-5' helicase n=1 Tax=Thermus filiformis TaxID=276 RepID=A0A0A2WMV1_THEFI|nr:3'-5' exonuclease [Thermus filiformis]KGQ21516.1 DNA helicase UvrD [Thermus filiformis]